MTHKIRVGVLGATSLVGRGLLPLLVEHGYQVTAFSRNVSETSLASATISWQIPDDISLNGQSIALWVSLAPIWVLPDYFAWFIEHGAKHVVTLSSTSRFTKVESNDSAEQALAQRFAYGEKQLNSWAERNGVNWTIFRPTLIYGFGLDNNISQIARLIRRFGFFPLSGEALGLRQPIHLQDLASACVASLEQPLARNRAFNVSGGEVLTYREMVNRIFINLGKRPRFVKAPLWTFRCAVLMMRILPRFRKWSPAMVERMNRDMVFDHTAASNLLGFSPRNFVLHSEDIPH